MKVRQSFHIGEITITESDDPGIVIIQVGSFKGQLSKGDFHKLCNPPLTFGLCRGETVGIQFSPVRLSKEEFEALRVMQYRVNFVGDEEAPAA